MGYEHQSKRPHYITYCVCACCACLQIADGYCVKYLASCVALLVYAAPLYFTPPDSRASQGQLTADYIRSMRLLQNTSRGIGDLIMVYKRVAGLAGHTSRVAELMETVRGEAGVICVGAKGGWRKGFWFTVMPNIVVFVQRTRVL